MKTSRKTPIKPALPDIRTYSIERSVNAKTKRVILCNLGCSCSTSVWLKSNSCIAKMVFQMIFIDICPGGFVYKPFFKKDVVQRFIVLINHIACIILVCVVFHSFSKFLPRCTVNISNTFKTFRNRAV